MLSRKARYGLRGLVQPARTHWVHVTSGELAARAGAPGKFLEAILLELARNKVMVSRRGKFGGHVLARPAGEISFAEIIRIIDGPLALAPCVSRLSFRKCNDCPDLATRSLREALLRPTTRRPRCLRATASPPQPPARAPRCSTSRPGRPSPPLYRP